MNTTKLESWLEWKDRCALALCSPEVQADLTQFANPILLNKLRDFSEELAEDFFAAGNASRAASDPLRGWHLFESHTHAVTVRTGKRHKDWMFEWVSRSHGDPQDLMEKAFSVQLRPAVRHYIEAETKWPKRESAFQLLVDSWSEDGDQIGVVLPDTLADDPSTLAALRELQSLAEQMAGQLFRSLDFRARAVLAAKEAGLSLANPAFEAFCGSKKSVLNELYQKVGQQIQATIQHEYAEEDPRTKELLHQLVLAGLKNSSWEWARAEKSGRDLFLESE